MYFHALCIVFAYPEKLLKKLPVDCYMIQYPIFFSFKFSTCYAYLCTHVFASRFFTYYSLNYFIWMYDLIFCLGNANVLLITLPDLFDNHTFVTRISHKFAKTCLAPQNCHQTCDKCINFTRLLKSIHDSALKKVYSSAWKEIQFTLS
jgi:hypothetical protein